MIDRKSTDALKKAIGTNHLSKLVEYAKSVNFSHNYGNESSLKTIFSYVLHGKREAPEIEDLILECAEHCHKERQAQKRKIKKFAQRIKKTA